MTRRVLTSRHEPNHANSKCMPCVTAPSTNRRTPGGPPISSNRAGPPPPNPIADRNVSDRNRLFRQVVEAAPNAIVMINSSGRIEMVNAQAERVFGYPRAEMLGQPIEILMPERFRNDHPELRAAFFSQPRPRPMEAGRNLYAVRKDGSEFPVEIGLNPIETDNGTMVLSAIVDISGRKREAERIQAALKEKDVLLGEVHHRVKNNLQVVYSLLHLQSAQITDPAALDLLRDSQNRIRSMAFIHQTLYSSKDFARVDFGVFIDTLLPALIESYAIDPGRIEVHVEVEPVRLPIDAAVPCGLVVNELISNAFKHAFPNDDRGEISIALTRRTNVEAVLSVSDTGVGLPDHVDPENTETLGLQLVRLLAEQIDGSVSVQRSAPTSFSMRFPI